jgi:hypothetical protein
VPSTTKQIEAEQTGEEEFLTFTDPVDQQAIADALKYILEIIRETQVDNSVVAA